MNTEILTQDEIRSFGLHRENKTSIRTTRDMHNEQDRAAKICRQLGIRIIDIVAAYIEMRRYYIETQE